MKAPGSQIWLVAGGFVLSIGCCGDPASGLSGGDAIAGVRLAAGPLRAGEADIAEPGFETVAFAIRIATRAVRAQAPRRAIRP